MITLNEGDNSPAFTPHTSHVALPEAAEVVAHKQWLHHTKRNVIQKTFIKNEVRLLLGKLLHHVQELTIKKWNVS